MIKELPRSYESNLAFEINGQVSLEDEKSWMSRLDVITDTYEKFNVMIVLGENTSWGMESGLADIKWIMKHMDKFNKIGIVAESDVWKWLIEVDSFFAKFVGIDEKYFDMAKLDEAWEWVKEQDGNI